MQGSSAKDPGLSQSARGRRGDGGKFPPQDWFSDLVGVAVAQRWWRVVWLPWLDQATGLGWSWGAGKLKQGLLSTIPSAGWLQAANHREHGAVDWTKRLGASRWNRRKHVERREGDTAEPSVHCHHYAGCQRKIMTGSSSRITKQGH